MHTNLNCIIWKLVCGSPLQGGHFFALLAGAEYLTGVKSTFGIHSNVLSFMPKLINSVDGTL
jgi:hypothetical protein